MTGGESRGCRDGGRHRVDGHQATRERKSGNQFQPRPQAATSAQHGLVPQLPRGRGTTAIDVGGLSL